MRVRSETMRARALALSYVFGDEMSMFIGKILVGIAAATAARFCRGITYFYSIYTDRH